MQRIPRVRQRLDCFPQHRECLARSAGLGAQLGSPQAHRHFPPVAAPREQQLAHRIGGGGRGDLAGSQTQFDGARGGTGTLATVGRQGQPVEDLQRRLMIALLGQQGAGVIERGIARPQGHQLLRRIGLAAQRHRLGRQRQQAGLQGRRIGKQQTQFAGDHRGGIRRALAQHGGAQAAPQRHLVGAGQARIVQGGAVLRAAGQQCRNGGQAYQVGIIGRARVAGGGERQHGLRLGAEAQRQHGLGGGDAGRGAQPGRHRPGAQNSPLEAAQQRRHGQGGEIEPAGQSRGVVQRGEVGLRPGEPEPTARQRGAEGEPVRHLAQDQLIRNGLHRHALPGR